jgi:hypothetical protein
VLFGGGLAAYLTLVFYGYGGLSPWLVLFVTSFAVAFWEYAKVYKKTIDAARRTRAATEEIVMKFDSRFLARIFRIRRDVPLIAPLRDRRQKTQMTMPILIFGFTAAFLPLAATMILSIAR